MNFWLLKLSKQFSNTFWMPHCLSNSEQNLPLLRNFFMTILNTPLNELNVLKILENPQNIENLDHVRFYGLVRKSAVLFSIKILTASWSDTIFFNTITNNIYECFAAKYCNKTFAIFRCIVPYQLTLKWMFCLEKCI